MSCIATFYVLLESKRDAFFLAKSKENQKRVKTHRSLLFFTRQIKVEEERLWSWLNRESSIRCNLDYSGFLIVDYLFTFHGQTCPGYFENVDDYASILSAENARRLSNFLSSHLPERHALEDFLRREKKVPDPELLDAFFALHKILLEWCALVKPDTFGVLYLSF